MKHIYFLLLSILIISCRPSEPEFQEVSGEEIIYPESIAKMFEAHGSLDQWNAMHALSYHVTRGERKEIHTVDLKNRKVLINGDGYDIGFDGQEAWISPDKSSWPDARPRFYHNLIFYFHSLVFLVGDSGINFSDKGIQEVDGEAMIEVSVTYKDGVGDSPEDEYILFIDPDTYNLKQIKYTVTYFTKEKRKEYNGLKYTSWKEVDGLLLPQEFKGYKVEAGVLTEERYTASFTDINFSMEAPDQSLFEVPEISVIDTFK